MYPFYNVNNGAPLQPTGVEDATQGSGNRYDPAESDSVDPNFQPPTIAGLNWEDIEASANIRREVNSQGDDQAIHRIQTGLAMRQELQRSSDRMVHMRLRAQEPDPGAGGSQWMAKCKGWGAPDSPGTDTRHPKRRKFVEEEGTGDRAAAQRGETQELRVRRTPARSNHKSKHGRGLEALSVPWQGLYHPIPLRPTVTGATLSLPNFEDQAWKNGEGAEETDGERRARLMDCEGGRWRCRECNGRAFADRSTLRRHCKSVHGTHNETLKCPYLHCTKEYKRQSGLNRHVREKHGGVEGHGGPSSSIL